MNAREGWLLACALLAVSAVSVPRAAYAMPPFAQAYGVKCSLCHTQVPTLNSYGRYVQRTGYGSLDPHVLRNAFPFWLGESVNLDSTNGTNPNKIVAGNVAIHAVGAIGNDITYHFQQWITQNNQAGGLDTFWVTYNNLLHRDGHLFLGKLTSPGPSAFSMFADMSSFSTPEITVGEHVWENDANRWGAKFNYERNALDVEVAWLGAGEDLGGISQYGPTIDKTVQWQVSYQPPAQPFGIGYVGNTGSWPLSDGTFDNYRSTMFYAQRDPVNGAPGALVMWQAGYDPKAGYDASGNPLGSAFSHASTFEIYEPFMKDGRAMVSLRKEFTNDGLGNPGQSGIVDLNYMVSKYLRFYAETGLAQNSTPSWRYMLWWTTPVRQTLEP